jgi:hypothetical protein
MEWRSTLRCSTAIHTPSLHADSQEPNLSQLRELVASIEAKPKISQQEKFLLAAEGVLNISPLSAEKETPQHNLADLLMKLEDEMQFSMPYLGCSSTF